MLVNNHSGMKAIYSVVVVCFFLTFGVGVFAMTLEPDESWILLSTMKAFGIPLPPTSAVDHPVLTSGGLHFLLHGLMALEWGKDILPHRLASLGSTLILLGIVFKLIESQVKDRVLAAAGTALFATAPGFLLQSSLATAEIVASTTFLLATLYWVYFGSRSAGMALLGGVLFGLACATRMTCLSMLPAILVWSVLTQPSWRARVIYPLLGIAVALIVFASFEAAYIFAFSDFSLTAFSKNALATGLSRPYEGIIMRLNYLTVGDGIIPVMGIVALTGWFITRLDAGIDDRKLLELCGLLFLAGCAGWLAWLFKSPIPHIRYLWPAIPLLWLTAILLGISALRRVTSVKTVMIAHVVIILMCAVQGALNVRLLAVGDSLALVYEYARQSDIKGSNYFFQARINQEETARLLEKLPASANIYALVEAAAYPLTYMSQRKIQKFRPPFKASAEDYLLIQPWDRSIWLPGWSFISWIKENASLVDRNGQYELYRVREGAQLAER